MDEVTESFDVVIVGGGPAGQAAALALQGSGLSMLLLDEQQRPGGQILRQPPNQFRLTQWLGSGAYAGLKAQLQDFEGSGAEWRGGRSVLGARPSDGGFTLLASRLDGGAERFFCRYLLIAAGCQDLAVPLPGWTLPGVMSAGGIQAFVKSQQFVPGERLLLAGTHPLMLVIADQIAAAGGSVAEVAFAQPRSSMIGKVLQHPSGGLSGGSNLGAAAAALVRLRRARVPVRYGRRLKALQGTSRVEAAEFEGGERVRCDAVGLCFGFVPQSELVRAAGAKMRRAGAAGGWAAIADEWHQSTVPKLFVAGETTGVQGAEIAGIEGAIAGIGIALTAGIVTGVEASSRAAPYRRRYKRAAAFAALLEAVADPTAYWPDVEPETLACRCEDVSFADLGAAIAASASANGVKLASRCGMGLCQGRNCEPTLLRLLAQAGRMDDPGFTARFPARPTAIGDLVR